MTVDSDEPTSKRARREVSPAMTFPYELDTFQKQSIDALEDGDSVLVSAHTSAGKTTVALYAIAKALREKKRVIYTSPIKALSNQKFREFSEKFDSVGLMTGDTTIKADSDCLVMTTEILRSMLYRGTEMLREVGCVIFDEVHYMRDKSRGVVWEETISLLPEGCQYVFLSATIPNAREFADWVESIHPGTKVHVIHTDYRPVPLQHYLYPCGADGIFLIVDEQGKFREDNFRRAMTSMGAPDGTGAAGGANGEDSSKVNTTTSSARGKQRSSRKGTQPIQDIIKLAMDRNMYPIIVFSFSKAECERNAVAISKLNFNNMEEDALVTEVFSNAMECLAEDDRKLPAIEHLLPLLKRGVGIHHSGLLPILKEVVEILFQAGLVKVLFSTETFSMGLNMPARTVVFTSVKKFDGEKNRYLTGGEYIQMSGRAGRRGLDRVGVVIAMVDEAVEHGTLKQLTGGGADVLKSSFHLTYNMVLNLLRVEVVDPEFMMRRSFAQFQRLRNRPALERRAEELTEAIRGIHVEQEEVFHQFTLCQELLETRRKQLGDILKQPIFLKRFTHAGRLLRIRRAADGVVFNWGICRTFHAKTPNADAKDASAYTVDVSVICEKGNTSQPTALLPCHVKDFTTSTADLYTLTFDFTDIESVARFRVNLPAEPDTETGRAQMVQTLAKLYRQYDDQVPLLTGEEMGVDDPQFEKLRTQVDRLEAQLKENTFVQNPTKELESAFEQFTQRRKLERELADIREELSQVDRAVFSEELKKMMRFLRRLDYIDKDNVILRKARVACEITTTDENEILLTELLFKGVLNSMETEMIVALMSCLVNVHRTPDGFSLPEEFQQPLKELNEIVSRIATVSMESGIVQEGMSVEKTMPSLMEVTYMWAKGAKFVDLMTKTNAYEGEIVRMMRRLEEQLRQMAGAARSPAIGSMELHDKFLKVFRADAAHLQGSLGRTNHPFVDAVKMLVSSGAGGDGASVMSHVHGNEFAGPGGGNGGNGGNVMLRCNRRLTDLSHLRALGPQVAALAGSVGFVRTAHGRSGRDLVLELPVGTEVVDLDTNEVVYDVDEDGLELLLLEGGQGGKGNAAFANKWHHSPTESTHGLPGNTMLVQFELKTIADVGLIGYPNAGKSSLLSAISSSKPVIAPYVFTTLRPYVGVIHDLYGNTCRVADLPGLIDGAYENRGLAHRFLRHVERTQSLAYVVDMSGSYTPNDTESPPEPWEVVNSLRQELEYYMPGLSSRALMVFANKMDLQKDSNGVLLTDKLEELRKRVDLPVFPISAALGIAMGTWHKEAGLMPALQLMCEEVFRKKRHDEGVRHAQKRREAFTLDKTFRAKNMGVFAAALEDECRDGDNVSLVDQQLDPYGTSGLGEDFDGYQHAASRGKLHDYRDLTMKGKYWSLTRNNGEKIKGEKW